MAAFDPQPLAIVHEISLGEEYHGIDPVQADHLVVMGHVRKSKVIHVYECVADERDVLEELGLG